MESDLQHQHHFFHDQQQKQMNSGLTRYQSAPSSYFSSFQDKDFLEDFLNRPTSPETERIFARFLSGNNTNTNTDNNTNTMSAQNFGAATVPIKQENLYTEQHQPQVMVDQTRLNQQQQQPQQQPQQQQSSYSSGFNYQSQWKPPLPDHNSSSGMDYRMNNSMGIERLSQIKPSGGNNSNLLRHNSSPAGLFSNINIDMENGFAVIRGMGDYGTGNRDASYSAVSRPPPSSGRMSPISEIGNKNMGENNPDSSGFSETQNNDYVSGFPLGSWEETALMTAGSKRLTEDDRSNSLNASENQSQVNGDLANRPPMLAHHLSLPKTAAELSAIEKYLQLTDSVPCKIRAKRGCATHPRSIAERVRRTRISERMRKLQDLVPNMDKQINTSDMLDLAVDYIKYLQKQVKTLSDTRAKCTCMGKPPPLPQ